MLSLMLRGTCSLPLASNLTCCIKKLLLFVDALYFCFGKNCQCTSCPVLLLIGTAMSNVHRRIESEAKEELRHSQDWELV